MTKVLYYPNDHTEALVAKVINEIDLNTVDLQIENTFEEVYNIPYKGSRLTQKGKVSKFQYPFYLNLLDTAMGYNEITQ